MRVIILNGSPKAHGNTATALHEVERTLQQQGSTAPGEVVRDEEGMQTMRQLGLNMAFLIKSIRLGLEQFGSPKIQEELTETHFIR
jgi:multimeric flavodoxin WrbA